MPKPVSAKQRRYMHAILNSSAGSSARGDRVPRHIARQYADKDTKGDNLPESKGKEHEGGLWGKKGEKKKAEKEKKSKKNLKKAFEGYYKGRGCGVIVVDDDGKILVGKDAETGMLSTPGGHVDPGETFEQAARRELKEEAHIEALDLHEVAHLKMEGNDCKVFVCFDWDGKPKASDELKSVKFVEKHLLADEKNMRHCCKVGLQKYFESHLAKSTKLKDMLAIETLEKNILRGPSGRDAVYQMSHGDALSLVGNGTFRFLKAVTKDMKDEDFRDVNLDNYIIKIRKHSNDIYSGRVYDGQKMIHQFQNRSLPEVCAQLMSVFEWYDPEDEGIFDLLDEDSLPDDAISGGLKALIDEYDRHNIANIYDEVEKIRMEIRNGAAVDLQQVEGRMMKLFDKLEGFTRDIAHKHNELCERAGDELTELENKLLQLQQKVEELEKQPETVEAVSANPKNPSEVYNDSYMYLTRPQVIVEPSGRIRITFGEDWTPMEKENYLQDMKARVVKKTGKK